MATRYWVGGSGTWDNSTTTNWSTASGGSGGASAPTSADNVVFDANSGTAATVTVTATATSSYTSVGKSDLTLSLSGSPTLTTSSYLTLTSGTVTLNNNILSIQSFFSPVGSSRTINFGTGSITCTGNNGNMVDPGTGSGLTTTGTATFNASYSGSVGTRVFITSASFFYNLNVTAGSDIVNFTFGFSGNYLDSVNLTGFTGSLATSTNPLRLYGSLTLGTGMNINAFTGTITFAATSSTKTITTNGVTVAAPIVINGSGLTVTPIGALTSSSSITLTTGSFGYPSISYALTVGSFTAAAGVGIYYGSGTWTITGSTFTLSGIPSFTSSSAGHKISMTSASTKTFVGSAFGGFANTKLEQGGAGALTISGNNSFASITNSVQPATITFTAGSTQTVSAFGVSGTAGNLVTLNSTSAGTQFTLSKSSGIVNVGYLSIQDSASTGGANWFAGSTSTNVSNNTGWLFVTYRNFGSSITNAGILQVNSLLCVFDEVTLSPISGGLAQRISNSAHQIAGYFDEVSTISPAASKLTNAGILQVSGYIDEVTQV